MGLHIMYPDKFKNPDPYIMFGIALLLGDK